ncbi:MAG TPA: alpha/beta hydrolase, partial [Chthoniobacterales bacterium]
MHARGEVLKLNDGGRIAYDTYGEEDGVAVLFCHGWPSSRSMAELADDAARKLGVRIISPDRPGIRDSTFKAERKLSEWPDVVRALLTHLRIDKVRVLAVSGGAPYAYMTGWALPENVAAIAVASGAPPIAELTDRSGLWRLHRWMLALNARNPALI